MNFVPKKTIVVPIDFSPMSEEAVRTGLSLAESPECVHVLHVTAPPVPLTYSEGWAMDDPVTRMKKACEHLMKFLDSKNIKGTKQLIREGDAGLVIADYAAEVHADLIVMPSHGYHGVKRLLLGSVAERVLRHANCPILMLRSP